VSAFGYTSSLALPVGFHDLFALQELTRALAWERSGVQFRPFTRPGGLYVAVSGPSPRLYGGPPVFGLTPGAYRMDNLRIAAYLNPGTAASRAVFSWRGGLTAGLVLADAVYPQLASGGSLLEPGFLGHTLWDVGTALISAAGGAAFGAVITGMFDSPGAGLAAGVIVSRGIGWFFDQVVEPLVARRLGN
jgi:hypothetical protein